MDLEEVGVTKEEILVGDVVKTISGEIEGVVINDWLSSSEGNIVVRYFYNGEVRSAILFHYEVRKLK